MWYRQPIGLLKRIRSLAQTAAATTCRTTTHTTSNYPKNSSPSISHQYYSDFSLWNKKPHTISQWILFYSQAAIFLGINSTVTFADDAEEATDLIRIEDGSVISNIHTSKWRVFTDNGRNLSLQGRLEEAERFFVLALQEAKEGFGENDPHVASACNNLAELYRVKKAFEKAEPYYLEAVKILEASFGPDDVRVGAALHNLGQFYLVQRRLEEAHIYYERALKIKGRVLGYGHSDYADTMYHLGTVMYLEGKEKDSETLIQNSIKILEECGQGESMTCLRRLRYLSQIHLKSNRLTEAENVQRKILHVMELSKGWNSLETVIAAERLALTLQSIGSLKESKELLVQCLNVRKAKLPKDHIQIGANMLHLARVAIMNSKLNLSEASGELEEAKSLLDNSIRIMQKFLDGHIQKKRNLEDEQTALVILLQSYISLGLLEITKNEFQKPREDRSSINVAEHAFRKCIFAYKESVQSGTRSSICNSADVKVEYLSCLNHLTSLISEHMVDGTGNSKELTLGELRDETKRIEADLSQKKKS